MLALGRSDNPPDPSFPHWETSGQNKQQWRSLNVSRSILGHILISKELPEQHTDLSLKLPAGKEIKRHDFKLGTDLVVKAFH